MDEREGGVDTDPATQTPNSLPNSPSLLLFLVLLCIHAQTISGGVEGAQDGGQVNREDRGGDREGPPSEERGEEGAAEGGAGDFPPEERREGGEAEGDAQDNSPALNNGELGRGEGD